MTTYETELLLIRKFREKLSMYFVIFFFFTFFKLEYILRTYFKLSLLCMHIHMLQVKMNEILIYDA